MVRIQVQYLPGCPTNNSLIGWNAAVACRYQSTVGVPEHTLILLVSQGMRRLNERSDGVYVNNGCYSFLLGKVYQTRHGRT
jgi:hypothetical protein